MAAKGTKRTPAGIRFFNLQRCAEMAVRDNANRDDFWRLMFKTYGYNEADYALECYDEIVYFIQEVAK